MPEAPEQLLTADEAAARLGITRSYLYRLIKRGVLPEAVGIRNGREVKLIPASALDRLDAHEGLLVRDVGEAERPATPAPERAAAGDRSVTGQPHEPGAYVALLAEMRAELRSLREELERERTARQELEGQLAQKRHAPPDGEAAAALSRANEVTALVKASEIKQSRILEELLAQRKWGRAKQIAYAAYLVVTTLLGIAAVMLIYQMLAQFRTLLEK